MKKMLLAVLLSAVFLWPVFGFAEESAVEKIDEVTVTATRSEETVNKIPAKVEVIDSRDIELTTGETLTEQLKKNASIGVVEYGTDLTGIGIRGFRPEFSGITKHSLVLIDGRPAGATNLSSILSDNIERIEVLKGPASSLYGSEAMGGVVNIITKKNTGKLTGLVETGLGSFSRNYQKAAIGGGLNDRMDFDISGSRNDQRGDIQMGNGASRSSTSYETRNGDIRLGMKLGDTWRVDVGADGYQGVDLELPGELADGDIASGKKDIERWGVDATVGGHIGERNAFSFTAYKTRELSENYQDYTGWGPYTSVPRYQSRDSEIDWMGFQIKDAVSFYGHKAIFGFDYQDIDTQSRYYNADGTRKAPYSPDESRENMAGYVETIFSFLDQRMTTTLGCRYDTFDVATEPTPYLNTFTPKTETFDTFSPRVGLNYLFDMGVRLHTTVGKAFVPPTAYQLAANSVSGATTTLGNPDLDPESSITWDAGIGFARASAGLSMDITYFHTDVDDKIISENINATTVTYRNSLGAEIHGLEYELSFDIGAPLKWDRSLTFFVNGTRIFNAEEEQTNHTMADVKNVATHTVNYGVGYDDGMIEARLNARFQGHMKDNDWNAAGYPEIEYPSFTVVDFSMGIKFKDHHRILANIDNLLDHDYYEKRGYPKPGMAFSLGYRYSF
ncbi:MAG: TonB-dependent receptor [Proteobacteria bacterium]|nr:TonB-dependent receptor [Pseudomonadota bacterium]MBU1386861.1 TonB-dependent receptor [Pseudomonadota bacterium]MBU1541428.1 TonB-dependent receptor [Pseudomonadota bacterium]MBU2480040.1 TonB-dependent receptor [Pseudomonadota bacterium]